MGSTAPRPPQGGDDGTDAQLQRREESAGRERPATVTGRDALIAVLCPLRRNLPDGAPVALLSALPKQLRELFGTCSMHHSAPAEPQSLSAFLDDVASHLNIARAEAERITRAVFAAVRVHLSDDEECDLTNQFEAGLKRLWSSSY